MRRLLFAVVLGFMLFMGLIWVGIIMVEGRQGRYLFDDFMDFLLYFALPFFLFLLFNGLLLFTSSRLLSNLGKIRDQKLWSENIGANILTPE